MVRFLTHTVCDCVHVSGMLAPHFFTILWSKPFLQNLDTHVAATDHMSLIMFTVTYMYMYMYTYMCNIHVYV